MHSLIIFVAKYFIFLSVAVVGIYWLSAKVSVKLSLAWQLVAGGILALALSVLAGHLYYDTRPFVSHHLVPLIPHAADNGFPSDHALLAAFLAFTMFLYSRRASLLLLIIAVLIGWARVATHIHSPIDIVGSFVIAGLSVIIVHLIATIWGSRRGEAGWRQRR